MTSSSYDGILFGMGNPLLDIIVTVDKEYLNRYDLKENDAILAEEKHMKIYEEIPKLSPIYLPGGATQNSINVAQWISKRPNMSTYTGSISDDDFGKKLSNACHKNGVKTIYYYNKGNEPTGVCACLIYENNRSLVTNLGAANCFSSSHLDEPEIWSQVEKAQVFYIGGFFLTVSPPSIMKVARHSAQNPNKTLIMNLSAPFICQFFKDPLLEALPYVNILFGNETEAATFAEIQQWDTKDIKEIAKRISEWPVATELELQPSGGNKRLVIITQGSGPVIGVKDGHVYEWPVEKMSNDQIVDTNGAGDAFVGGFLAQFVEGKPLDECVRCGIWAATLIIQQVGCSLPEKCTFE